MPTYEVDYNYLVREFGTQIVEAENVDEAELIVEDMVREINNTVEEIEFETIKEIIR